MAAEAGGVRIDPRQVIYIADDHLLSPAAPAPEEMHKLRSAPSAEAVDLRTMLIPLLG